MLMTMHSVRCVRSMRWLEHGWAHTLHHVSDVSMHLSHILYRAGCIQWLFSDRLHRWSGYTQLLYCLLQPHHHYMDWRRKKNASLRTSELPPMSIQARRSLHFIYACIRQIILLASSVFSYLRVIWLRFCVRWSCYSLHLHLDCSQLLSWPQMAWVIDRMEYCLKLSWASDSNQLDLTSIARCLFIQCKAYIGNRLTCK